MVVYMQGSPTHGCCLVGQHQAEIGWFIDPGSFALMPPCHNKISLFNLKFKLISKFKIISEFKFQ